MLVKVFNVEGAKFCIIPNGISTAFHDGDPSLFEQAYGVTDFVLNVALIEPRKNQLALVRAMKRLPYTLVLVGKASQENEKYLSQIKAEAGGNVRFVGAIRHDDPMLASCYSAAKLFVLPSFYEVMPLTLNEAAVAGCRILASYQVPVSESFASLIERFHPNDVEILSRLIDSEMRAGKTIAIRQAVTAMPTWNNVGAKLSVIYQEVCASSNRSENVFN